MTRLIPILCLLLFSSYYLRSSHVNPCDEAKIGAEAATVLAKTSVYDSAIKEIQAAFDQDRKEHAVAFGRDRDNNIIKSQVNNGGQTNGIVPRVSNAFADLHNHPGNHPPDAGDLYGLIDNSQKQKEYITRVVLTFDKTVYALVVTNPEAAAIFNVKYPRDRSGCVGCSPKFPEAIVDEFREMKYGHGCTDEMVLAFILEKYNAGISLLKQQSNGSFAKLRTSIIRHGGSLSFTPNNCP